MSNMYVLGTAEFGVTGVPTLIRNERELRNYFGDKGTLIDFYRSACSGDNDTPMYLCKANGSHSICYLNILDSKNTINHNALEFKSVFSNDIYNNISVIITDTELYIKDAFRTLKYSFKDFRNVDKLIAKINKDAEVGVSSVIVTNYSLDSAYLNPALAITSCNKPINLLKGARTGLDDTKNEIFFSMTKTLENLVGNYIDVIVFANCYIDDIKLTEEEILRVCKVDKNPEETCFIDTLPLSICYLDNNIYSKNFKNKNDYLGKIENKFGFEQLSFYNLMLDFCVRQESSNIITKGVIGFRPITEETPVGYYTNYRNYILENIKEVYKDFLGLVSITCGDLYYCEDTIIDNQYIAYSKILNTTDYNRNVENIKLGNNIKIRSSLKNSSLNYESIFNELLNLGFIFCRESFYFNSVVANNTVTLSTGLTKYEYIIRSVQYIYKNLRHILDEHLGEEINNETESKLSKDIKAFLNISSLNCPIAKSDFEILTNDNKSTILITVYFYGYLDPLKFSLELN